MTEIAKIFQNKMPTLPRRLVLGDTLGLICPASAPPKAEVIDQSVAALEKLGFKVKVGKNTHKRWGYLAGQDRERADDIMQMFTDRKVNGIVCVRGGYGTPRILPLLDYATIRKNPKVFVGFSDITALHCAFLTKANLLSFHGPMTASHFIPGVESPEFSTQRWLNTMSQSVAAGSVKNGYQANTISILRKGKASGQLIGGNLSLLVSLIGTPYLPDFKGKILFLEDVDERPYRIDRMLTQFLNSGLLQKVAGVAVGLCDECHDPRAVAGGEYRQSLEDVLKDRLGSLKVPVVTGLPFGHVPFNATLPFGGFAELDGINGDIIITQAAVK